MNLYLEIPLQSCRILEITYGDDHLKSVKLCPQIRQISQIPDNTPDHLKYCLQWLDDFFSGRQNSPDWTRLKPEWVCSDFAKNVYLTLAEIHAGRTLTYGELAEKSGRAGAARAIGHILHINPFHLIVPCHRVVSKNGNPWLFQAGCDVKKELLQLENIFL